jgi:hypothetical protein
MILQFAREVGETSDQVGAQPNSDAPPPPIIDGKAGS